MWGQTHQAAEPLVSTDWKSSTEYCFGVDLFNHGFYWEAHEAWEALWHAAGRTGMVADFMKGLIKLAAAGVKAREGNPRGVRRHATRSAELLSALGHSDYSGLRVGETIEFAHALIENHQDFAQPAPELVLDFVIHLHGN